MTTRDITSDDARTKAFIETNCVVRKSDERLLSRTGRGLGWLIDLRPAFLDSTTLADIAAAFWSRHRHELPFQVAGMEVAAIPLVAAILLKGSELGLPVSGLIIRKQRKNDGRGRAVEGTSNGQPVILVDDTFNSGQSLERARSVLEAEGAAVRSLFVVIDYQAAAGRRWLDRTKLPLLSLFRLQDFGLRITEKRQRDERELYTRLWQHRSESGSSFYVNPKSGIVSAGGSLFFGTEAGALRSVDSRDGSLRWETSFPNTGQKGVWSTPAVSDDSIFVGAYNGNVYRLNAANGNVVWSNNACEWVGSSPMCIPDLDTVVIGLEYERPRIKGGIAAFRMSDGEKLWEHPLNEYQHGSSSYLRANNSVITGTNDHNVISLDASTGRQLWTFPTRRSVKYAPALDAERGLAAFASFDTSIYIVDAVTGAKRMEIRTEEKCYTTPLFTAGKMFCGSGDRHLYVVDVDTFRPIGKLDLKARVFAPPVVVGDHVVVGTTGGAVFFIDRHSLRVESRIVVPDSVTNSVVASEDGSMLYVPTCMNDVFGFKTIAS